MKKLGFIALLLLTGLWACEYETLSPKEIDIPENISFAVDVAPPLETNCKGCHSGGIDPNLTAAASWNALVNGGYVDRDNPEESPLLIKINKPHPSSDPLTLKEKAIILKWIEDGAQNN